MARLPTGYSCGFAADGTALCGFVAGSDTCCATSLADGQAGGGHVVVREVCWGVFVGFCVAGCKHRQRKPFAFLSSGRQCSHAFVVWFVLAKAAFHGGAFGAFEGAGASPGRGGVHPESDSNMVSFFCSQWRCGHLDCPWRKPEILGLLQWVSCVCFHGFAVCRRMGFQALCCAKAAVSCLRRR